MTIAAVIVAAGSGLRAGGERPKQYQVIGGKPVIWWSIKAFCSHPRISYVQPVIGDGHLDMFKQATGGLAVAEPVIGGPTRQESCRLGISAVVGQKPSALLIHDAARPFVTPEIIDRVIVALDAHEGAIPALAVADTVKRAPHGLIETTVDRAGLWTAQTPQGFRFDAIRNAHNRAAAAGVLNLTDDAAVAEWAGMKIAIVNGAADNRKITTGNDVIAADRIMQAQRLAGLPDIRVGQGIDFHSFEAGDSVILCGISIPYDKKLKGHSDADVAMHALTDAILGAIAEGDIGHHFPPSDMQWKGAASRIFLEKAAALVAGRGGGIMHVDLTVLAEAPRIGPYVAAMRANLCSILGLSADRVAIKATTTERMGFIGRGEGVAALATATVRLPLTAP